MKITTISFLLLLSSLFFFAFPIKYFAVVAQSEREPAVRDITGKILRTGVKYYILPVIRGSGGGLTVASNRNHSCPLDVVQEPLEVSEGIPLTFTPVNPKKGVIYEYMDLNFKFHTTTICAQSTVWRFGGFDESTRQYFISTNGVEGNPGPETLNNWFKIAKERDAYKLIFCPGLCDSCGPMCGEIGIYIDAHGSRNLALISEEVPVPVKVMFKRV